MCGGHVDVISSTTNDYSDTSSKGLLIYNPQRDEWRSGPDMTESRIGAVSGVFGGSMVIVGGHGYLPGHYTATDLLSGERFCHETRAWKPISDVPYNINGATACVLNDRLFVIGGIRSKKLLIWNKTTDTWTEGASMHTTRYGGVCVVLNGKIMVIGGFENSSRSSSYSVIFYDMMKDTWENGLPLPILCPHYNVVKHCETIFLFGRGKTLKFENDKWSVLTFGDPFVSLKLNENIIWCHAHSLIITHI
tara:strand:- start:710 stop:1456 length:747 start_codon:yes stop_codon:yes gene_type:complete